MALDWVLWRARKLMFEELLDLELTTSFTVLLLVYNLSMLKKEASKIESELYLYIKEGCRDSKTKIEIIKKTLLLILNDFFDKKIELESSLYLLEAFAGDMLFVVNTPEEIKKDDVRLADVLDVAADITFSYQEGLKKGDLNEYNKLVGQLKDYLSTQTKDK